VNLTPELALARKKALVMIGTGVPAVIVCVFGLIFAFRKAKEPLMSPAFWVAFCVMGAIFAIYFGVAWTLIRKVMKDGGV